MCFSSMCAYHTVDMHHFDRYYQESLVIQHNCSHMENCVVTASHLEYSIISNSQQLDLCSAGLANFESGGGWWVGITAV